MPLVAVDVGAQIRIGDSMPFAWLRDRRRGWVANNGQGLLGLDGELDEETFDELTDEFGDAAIPALATPASVTPKAKKKKKAIAKKAAKFAAKRAAKPGYKITAGGLVSQKGGVTARAHIEDQLFNRGERARRTVRDKAEELRVRALQKKAALFDAEQRRQDAIRAAKAELSTEQTKTLLAQREAEVARQEAEFARRVDPSAERDFVDDDFTDDGILDEGDPTDFGLDDELGDDEYLDEAYEGVEGFFDFVKKVLPAAASFIPGVGPIVGAVAGAALNSKGGQAAVAVDPKAQIVQAQNGAPTFQVQIENVGKLLIDALGRVIAKKTGGQYQPVATPKPVDEYVAEKKAAKASKITAPGATQAATLTLPVVALGALALVLAMRRR
jgi:hypothetical protein